jgi:hypothetical protein
VGAAGLAVLLAGGVFDRRVDRAVRRALQDHPDSPAVERIAQDMTWLDFFASADPVTEGAASRPVGRRSASHRVQNRRSTGWDHTAYWLNREQFLKPLGDLLCQLLSGSATGAPEHLGHDGGSEAERRLDASYSSLRRRRTVALVVARRAVGGAVLAAIALFARGDGGAATVRSWIVAATDWVFGLFSGNLADATRDLLETKLATAAVAVLVSVAAGALFYRLAVMPVWLWWERGILGSFYAKREPEAWTGRQVLLRIIAVVPLVAAIAVAVATWDAEPLAAAVVTVLTALGTAVGALWVLREPYVWPAPRAVDAELVRLGGADGGTGRRQPIALPREGGHSVVRGTRGVWASDVTLGAAVLFGTGGDRLAEIGVGGEPIGMGAGGGVVWIATTHGICCVDEERLAVRGWIDDLPPVMALAPAAGALWLLDQDRSAYRLDLGTLRVTRVLPPAFVRLTGDGEQAVGLRAEGAVVALPKGDGPERSLFGDLSIMTLSLGGGGVWGYSHCGRLVTCTGDEPHRVLLEDGGPDGLRARSLAATSGDVWLSSAIFRPRSRVTEIVRAGDAGWTTVSQVPGASLGSALGDADGVWIATG